MISTAIWGAFIVLLVIVTIGYFGKNLKSVSGIAGKSKWPLSENATWLTVMWVFLLIILPLVILPNDNTVPYATSPRGLWWGLLFSWNGVLITLGFVIFGYVLPEDPKIPFRMKLAKFGIVTLVFIAILFVWKTFSHRIAVGGDEIVTTVTNKVKDATKSNTSPFFRGQYTFQTEADRFWYGNIPSREAWDMMDVIKIESGFRQFNPDGSVLRGDVNPSDTGMHQINLEESKDEIAEAGCNVEEIECNFKVALLIYRKYGLKRWVPYETVKNLTVSLQKIPVPVGIWSEVSYIERGSNCHRQADRNMLVRDSSGRLYEATKDKFPPIDSPTQQYIVDDGEEAGTVEVRCR